jgi:ubiquinone/menaquinone biosynthesis C-methylase UbiE
MPQRAEYDRIGSGYRWNRRPDPRLARMILRELGAATSVANVGAGTGSYEPVDRFVVAVEPSTVMLQRARDAGPSVRATAERLPFRDHSFDAAMAILTVHHWTDVGAGLDELSRVARERILILTWDPSSEGFWLMTDYFLSPLERLEADLGTGEWHRRWGHLLDREYLDIGYRLVVCHPAIAAEGQTIR